MNRDLTCFGDPARAGSVWQPKSIVARTLAVVKYKNQRIFMPMPDEFNSGRLDHQMYFKAIRVEQAHLETVVLDRILNAWLTEALLIEGYLPDLGEMPRVPHTWFFDGHEHVDPLKESSAQALRLANHTTTYADEYARRGLDWETQLRQRAKELALRNELGLATPGPVSNTNTHEDTPPEDNNAEPDSPPPEED